MAARTVRITLLAIALLALGVSGAGVAASAHAGQGENRAGLVVQFSGDDVRTYCLAFQGDSTSGLDLLQKSGLDLKVEVYGAMGAQVCKIDVTGCDYPGQPCACQSYGPGGVYWSYHHLRDGAWRTSITGASGYAVHPGDVEGWAWSTGTPPSQVYTFEQICPASQPPAPTATPPAPPMPTPRPALPSATPRPPATATRRPAPQATATQPSAFATPMTAPTSTNTPAPMPTATGTPTPVPPTPTATPMPSATPTLAPAAPSPTPTVVAGTSSSENAARYVGWVVGAAVLGGLAVWGGLRLARGRQRSGGDVG